MKKIEFEELTMRGDATITYPLYEEIESFYMSDNDYHKTHGGIYEDKKAFCARVFGGKVNTAKSILTKITKEAQAENAYALQGCNVPKNEMDRMNTLISENMATLSKMKY